MNNETVLGVVKYTYTLGGKTYKGNDIIYKHYNTKKATETLKKELIEQVGADSLEIQSIIYK
jgi:hypothetical protein